MTATNIKTKKPRKVKGRVEIDIEKCKGCELCTVVCKENTLELSKTINKYGYRYAVTVNDDCTGCINCALICPDGVIKVYRTTAKKRELVATISNVSAPIEVKIDNPVLNDLQNMEYL